MAAAEGTMAKGRTAVVHYERGGACGECGERECKKEHGKEGEREYGISTVVVRASRYAAAKMVCCHETNGMLLWNLLQYFAPKKTAEILAARAEMGYLYTRSGRNSGTSPRKSAEILAARAEIGVCLYEGGAGFRTVQRVDAGGAAGLRGADSEVQGGVCHEGSRPRYGCP
eukprot:2572991-Rhodomonas_salina.1